MIAILSVAPPMHPTSHETKGALVAFKLGRMTYLRRETKSIVLLFNHRQRRRFDATKRGMQPGRFDHLHSASLHPSTSTELPDEGVYLPSASPPPESSLLPQT
ncbi:hypothetical protein R1CP_39725 (plasmid) [Rhodococcus opacus]|uniref:Uncharacterized protein n=1 Tax=Rhodococcus opacus TaxID=37919 RepID=A0A1B1KIV8_RHOOP|nr:hypothetical protein R1CP_39725 [Rhodococcus opacus]